MIARIWHGRTPAAKMEAYTGFLKVKAIPDYQKTTGFKGLSFLRQLKGEEGHFQLITYWENWEVIKNFAGENIEKANFRKVMEEELNGGKKDRMFAYSVKPDPTPAVSSILHLKGRVQSLLM